MLIFYVFNYCYADQHRHANHRHLQNGAALRLVPHHASEDGATENEVSNPLFLIAAVGFDNGDIVVQLWPRMVLSTLQARNPILQAKPYSTANFGSSQTIFTTYTAYHRQPVLPPWWEFTRKHVHSANTRTHSCTFKHLLCVFNRRIFLCFYWLIVTKNTPPITCSLLWAEKISNYRGIMRRFYWLITIKTTPSSICSTISKSGAWPCNGAFFLFGYSY